jgi:iron complex outermembrane recepter protein
MVKYPFLIFLLFVSITLPAQVDTLLTDSVVYSKTYLLPEAGITSYRDSIFNIEQISSVSIMDGHSIEIRKSNTFLSSANSIAGVRMEERSPLSYRFSIRGSLLRSPFGVRNIKVYLDDLPLTDAGGNTYLNLIDVNFISSAAVVKGPAGSDFGANTGGLLFLKTYDNDFEKISVKVNRGSFNTFGEYACFKKRSGKYAIQFHEQYRESAGYRDNSNSSFRSALLNQSFAYGSKNSVKLLTLFTSLDYRTPGGLTLLQKESDRTASRPATAVLRGAAEQKAGVSNNTIFTGLVNKIYFTPSLYHFAALQYSHTDFKNPFITNFETRKESAAAIRTFISISNDSSRRIRIEWKAGGEGQKLFSTIKNYGNNFGVMDTLHSEKRAEISQLNIFAGITLLYKSVTFEGSLGYNYSIYSFPEITAMEENAVTSSPELMPRAGISVRLSNSYAWRFNVSRGFSQPALAEIIPSGGRLNTNLNPESGWNYESGVRYRNLSRRIRGDFTVYYFKLEDAIVRRTAGDDTEFFINAGSTLQPGAELEVQYKLIPLKTSGLIRYTELRVSLSYTDYEFNTYQTDNDDYSGNRITGVPKQTATSSMEISIPFGLSFFLQHQFISSFPLDDGNTSFSEDVNVFDVSISWKKKLKSGVLEIYLGVQNIFEEDYSLGYDLNAAGKRNYNPAPLRALLGGVKVSL